MVFSQDFAADSSAVGGDFSTRTAGGGSFGGDLSTFVGGLATTMSQPQAAGAGGNAFLTSALTGALSLVPGGGVLSGIVGPVVDLFAPKPTDAAQQSADVNRIAANNGITGTEAAAVIAWHANHSSDHFNDLAAYVANNNGRFASLLEEYNAGNPTTPIRVGSVRAQAEQVATQQQQLITTALTSNGFAASVQGQNLIAGLQAAPSNAVVGTQGQTAGDVLKQVLVGIGNGAIKGGSDAAAETEMGKSFKQDYMKTWLKENQLLAGVITAVLGYTAYRAYAPKRGRTSL